MSIDLDAIRSRIAETPPKLATIREMSPAEIAQVLTDRAALVDEVERLRAENGELEQALESWEHSSAGAI